MSVQPNSHIASVDGVTIHYVSWGSAAAPPVVLLHGLRAYGEWFAPLGEALAGRAYVVAPDLRGRNLSGWAKDGDYTVEAYCRDLAGLAVHLKLGRFALGGHSLGAAIVSRYASAHPEQIAALMLFDGSPEPDPRGRGRIMDEVARTPVDGFPSWDAARAFLRTIHTKGSDAHIKTRLRCMLKEEGGALKWRIDRACTKPNIGTTEQYWASLRAIKCPTLHLRGSESDLLSADVHARMTAATPDGYSVVIPGAAHMVIEDNEKGMVDATVTFLERHYLNAKAA